MQREIDAALLRFLFNEPGCGWDSACHDAGMDEDKILEMPCTKAKGKRREKGWYSNYKAAWCKAKANAWLVDQCEQPYSHINIRYAADAFQLMEGALLKYLDQQRNKRRTKKHTNSSNDMSTQQHRTSHAPVSQTAPPTNSPTTRSANFPSATGMPPAQKKNQKYSRVIREAQKYSDLATEQQQELKKLKQENTALRRKIEQAKPVADPSEHRKYLQVIHEAQKYSDLATEQQQKLQKQEQEIMALRRKVAQAKPAAEPNQPHQTNNPNVIVSQLATMNVWIKKLCQGNAMSFEDLRNEMQEMGKNEDQRQIHLKQLEKINQRLSDTKDQLQFSKQQAAILGGHLDCAMKKIAKKDEEIASLQTEHQELQHAYQEKMFSHGSTHTGLEATQDWESIAGPSLDIEICEVFERDDAPSQVQSHDPAFVTPEYLATEQHGYFAGTEEMNLRPLTACNSPGDTGGVTPSDPTTKALNNMTAGAAALGAPPSAPLPARASPSKRSAPEREDSTTPPSSKCDPNAFGANSHGCKSVSKNDGSAVNIPCRSSPDTRVSSHAECKEDSKRPASSVESPTTFKRRVQRFGDSSVELVSPDSFVSKVNGSKCDSTSHDVKSLSKDDGSVTELPCHSTHARHTSFAKFKYTVGCPSDDKQKHYYLYVCNLSSCAKQYSFCPREKKHQLLLWHKQTASTQCYLLECNMCKSRHAKSKCHRWTRCCKQSCQGLFKYKDHLHFRPVQERDVVVRGNSQNDRKQIFNIMKKLLVSCTKEQRGQMLKDLEELK